MKLSEKLHLAIGEYVEGELKLPDLIRLLCEARDLAKRYEDAPVAKAGYYYRPTMGAATGVMFEGPDFTPLAGQRVRIVLDKEG